MHFAFWWLGGRRHEEGKVWFGYPLVTNIDSTQEVSCLTNVCFRTEARDELHSRMDLAIISYLLQYITRRLYVLCGYRGFEEAIRKKQMPNYPPWYIGVYNSPCSLLPCCRNIILAGTGASVQETLFPFSNAVTHTD